MIEQLKGPPAIILGGHANSLSVARSLGRRGIRVLALAHPSWVIRHSRYVERIELPGSGPWNWDRGTEFLTSSQSDAYAGAVLLTGSDEGLTILTDHRDVLQKKFLLDRCNPEAQRCLLDKITTYQTADAAGVPTPRYWIVKTDLDAVAGELRYPLIVKPRLSHLSFEVLGGRKFVHANNLDEAKTAVARLSRGGIESFLVEFVPGPDDTLCSYYTYLDEKGDSLFDYTKRVIRRVPKNMGLGTYHITDHVPEIRDRSLRLFRHAGLQGLANVEYKFDARDGEYKLIECNARFTGATSLVAASGLDLAETVYRQIVGLPVQEFGPIRQGKRLWDPVRDFAAFRELRGMGETSLVSWLRSVARPQTLPIWAWHDPLPSVAQALATGWRIGRRGGRRLLRGRSQG
jgi:D-aspartate ligase